MTTDEHQEKFYEWVFKKSGMFSSEDLDMGKGELISYLTTKTIHCDSCKKTLKKSTLWLDKGAVLYSCENTDCDRYSLAVVK